MINHPIFLILFAGLFGLCIGSFLNVVIYRLPKVLMQDWKKECRCLLKLEEKKEATLSYLSLSKPRSHCPSCKKTIPFWLNLPILGYLFCQGRCHFCQTKISKRYLLVELLGGITAALILWQWGISWETGAALLFSWLLIPLVFIDIEHQLLPDNLIYLGLWFGLLFNLQHSFASLQDAVIGAVAGYLSLWTVGFLFRKTRKKEGIGYGDFKLFAMIGAWLGWKMLPFVLLQASLLGLIVGGISLLYRKQDHRITTLPFGPYLAINAWVMLLWNNPILLAYQYLF